MIIKYKKIKERNLKKRINKILISLLLILFIFFLSFNILLWWHNFHSFLIKKYNNEQYYIEIDRNVTLYITGLSKNLNTDFNELEKSHMRDVRNLVLINYIIFIILSLFIVYFIKKRMINSELICPFSLVILFTIIFSISIVILFEKSFELFHYILFPQGNWRFQADSLMLTTYQESFFKNFFICNVALFLIISLILIFLIKYFYKS